MTGNAQKTPIARSLISRGHESVLDAIQHLGKALPCSIVSKSGAIVTIKFETQGAFTLPQITIPILGWRYIRIPVQVGDKGFTMPCDVFLGAMSGLGTGIAEYSGPMDIIAQGNLANLVFVPVGNTAWAAVDPNAVVLTAPNGVVLQDDGRAATITLTPSGIAITGNVTITGTLNVTGDIVGDAVDLKTHRHTGVQTGSGDSGPPA